MKLLGVLAAVCLSSAMVWASDAEVVLSHDVCADVTGAEQSLFYTLEQPKLEIGALRQPEVEGAINAKGQKKYLAQLTTAKVYELAKDCFYVVRTAQTAKRISLKYSFNKVGAGCDQWESTGKPEGWTEVPLVDNINRDNKYPIPSYGYNFIHKKICVKPRYEVVSENLVLDFSDARKLNNEQKEVFMIVIKQQAANKTTMDVAGSFISEEESSVEYKVRHGKPAATWFTDKLKFDFITE